MKKHTRLGVYGIILQEKRIALTTKTLGSYKGLLDLPGGGVEFGEGPEETLRREIREEVAMEFASMAHFDNLSHVAKGLFFENNQENDLFHHLGQIYWVKEPRSILDINAEDPWDWYHLESLDLENLTPFAKVVIGRLQLSV